MPEPAKDRLTATCPQCETRFRVTVEQLAVAKGRVRCGACLTVFDCSDLVSEREPTPAKQPAAASTAERPAVEHPTPIKAPVVATHRPRRPRRRQRQPRQPLPTGLLASGYAAAGILLGSLVFALQFPVWSQDPALRGIYQTVCAALGCDLPTPRSLAEIEIANGPAGSRTGPPDPLVLALEMTNKASFRQPFPVLAARLTSADGSTLEERQFEPNDYLPTGHSRQMTRERTIAVELHLEDPGPQAVSYQLSVL